MQDFVAFLMYAAIFFFGSLSVYFFFKMLWELSKILAEHFEGVVRRRRHDRRD